MNKIFWTDKARQSAIEDINSLKIVLMHKTGEQLDYMEYRKIVDYLIIAEQAIRAEMEE